MIEAKRRIKESLKTEGKLLALDPEFANLNPEGIVFSYSGRLVKEKAGRKRAFTNKNIERLLQWEAQVIYFANVQAGPESRQMFEDLKQLQKTLNEKYRGDRKSVV